MLMNTSWVWIILLWSPGRVKGYNNDSGWVIVVKRQMSNFLAISWREQATFWWDDDDDEEEEEEDKVRFVLDQHAEFDLFSACSLKQQSAGRHVAPLGYIPLIPSLCSCSLELCFWRRSNRYRFYCLWFDLTLSRLEYLIIVALLQW